MSAPPVPRPGMSARKRKVLLLAGASLACAVPGLIALATDSEPLGYVSLAVLVAGIIAGPVIDRVQGTGG